MAKPIEKDDPVSKRKREQKASAEKTVKGPPKPKVSAKPKEPALASPAAPSVDAGMGAAPPSLPPLGGGGDMGRESPPSAAGYRHVHTFEDQPPAKLEGGTTYHVHPAPGGGMGHPSAEPTADNMSLMDQGFVGSTGM